MGVSKYPLPDRGLTYRSRYDIVDGMPTENRRLLGEYLKQRRVAAGLSQQQLAERLGSTQPAIARLEAGGIAPSLTALDRIAEAVGCDLVTVFVPRDAALVSGVPFRFERKR